MLMITRDTTERIKGMIERDVIDHWSDEALRGFIRGLLRAYELRCQLERVDATQDVIDALRKPTAPVKHGFQVIDGGKT